MPAPLAEFQKTFHEQFNQDITPQLTKFYKKHAKDKNVEWGSQTTICPICESATFYATASKKGKTTAHKVGCENCHSQSAERSIECTDLLKIQHLRHVDHGPG